MSREPTAPTRALFEACRMGSPRGVDEARAALDSGADIGHRDAGQGSTPLFFALHARRADVAQLLIERGADVFARDDNGGDALRWPCWRADADLLDLLLRAGASSLARFDLDRALLAACESSESDERAVACMGPLLAAGASPRARGAGGRSALILAARRGGLARSVFLIEHGADPLAVDDLGNTAAVASRGDLVDGSQPDLEAFLRRAELSAAESLLLGAHTRPGSTPAPRRGSL